MRLDDLWPRARIGERAGDRTAGQRAQLVSEGAKRPFTNTIRER